LIWWRGNNLFQALIDIIQWIAIIYLAVMVNKKVDKKEESINDFNE
jgi:hypothetical protein